MIKIIFIQSEGDWSTGKILASGARDIGFDSRIAPFFYENFYIFPQSKLKAIIFLKYSTQTEYII